MKRPKIPTVLCLCALILAGCVLPKNQSNVMHGDVRGGEVPLYMLGSLGEFAGGGLVIPSRSGYVRTEWDIMDMGADGALTPAWGSPQEPLAQVAIPRLISTINLPGGYEVRRALMVDQEEAWPSYFADARTSQAPRASLWDDPGRVQRHIGSVLAPNTFLEVVPVASPVLF